MEDDSPLAETIRRTFIIQASHVCISVWCVLPFVCYLYSPVVGLVQAPSNYACRPHPHMPRPFSWLSCILIIINAIITQLLSVPFCVLHTCFVYFSSCYFSLVSVAWSYVTFRVDLWYTVSIFAHRQKVDVNFHQSKFVISINYSKRSARTAFYFITKRLWGKKLLNVLLLSWITWIVVLLFQWRMTRTFLFYGCKARSCNFDLKDLFWSTITCFVLMNTTTIETGERFEGLCEKWQ